MATDKNFRVKNGLTVDGDITAVNLDISGNVDVDGTLEADAITLNGTSLAASATTDTTNASNIGSGTLASGRLPDLAVSDFAASAIVLELEGIGSNDNDNTLPTSAAVKDYVDSNAGSDTDVNVSNLTARLPQITESVTIGDATDVTVTTSGDLTVTGDLNVSEIVDPTGTGNLKLRAGGSTINILDGGVANHINITPASGRLNLMAETIAMGDADVTMTTRGAYDLTLSTNTGTDSGTIKIFDGANGNITLTPNGTGNVSIGNFTFDADQSVGSGQDNHVLTYDNSAGTISLEAASGGGASVMGDLTDVSMDITNFVDGFLLQTNSDGSAPTTGTLNSATGNIGIGKDVLKTITTADHVVAIGSQAGDSITSGNRNILIGEFAGEAVDTGTDNVIIGARAGRAIHDRTGAVMIGRDAGTNAQSSGVVFIGENAGSEATSDQFGYTIAIGHDAGEYGASASNAVMIGKSAGKGDSSNTNNPSNMTAVGYSAMEAITTGDDNSAFGNKAMQNITTGSDNIAFGSEALNDVTTGDRNIGIGYKAADGFDTESDNVAIGFAALGGSIAGAEKNVAIGNYTGDALTSGDENTLLGHEAGTTLTTAKYSVAVGYRSLKNTDTGDRNTAVGYLSMEGASNNSADQNAAFGGYTLKNVQDGATGNTGLGYLSLSTVTTGDKNIAVGYESGDNITTGSNNVVIGGADVSSATGSDQLSISSGDGSPVWITGDSSGHVSLGNFVFDADQSVGSGQDNYVLTYDHSDGQISLEAAAGGVSLSGSTNNQLVTVTGSNAIQGESGLTWDGSTLIVSGGTGDAVLSLRADSDNSDEKDQPYMEFVLDGSTTHSSIGHSSDVFHDDSTDNNTLIIANSVATNASGSGIVLKTGEAAGHENAVDALRIYPSGETQARKTMIKAVSSNTTLGDDDSGKTVYWTGGTLTLPATAESGQQFVVINNTNGSATPALGTSNAIATNWTAHAAMADETARTYIAVAANTWIYIG